MPRRNRKKSSGEMTSRPNLEQRVIRAAETALAEKRYVTALDVFLGLRWLGPADLDRWRQGRVDYLERVTRANLGKISSAMKHFHRWARRRGLRPSETGYVARTRDRRHLRFSKSGDPSIELAYRTHWVSPELSAEKRERVARKLSRPPDLVVISPLKEWECARCNGTGTFLLKEDDDALCMACGDMDHLVFLPSGDAALTRRAKKASRLSAVVVRFSRSRGRYERQGILVEEPALERAEQECLADEDARARRRERDREWRTLQDSEFQEKLEKEILDLFPRCPPERAAAIARHTSVRGSGRLGRSAAGRSLDPNAITLAVGASIRHCDTGYDDLLMSGLARTDARDRVQEDVTWVLNRWRRPE